MCTYDEGAAHFLDCYWRGTKFSSVHTSFEVINMIKKVKVKVKLSRYKPCVAQRVGRGIALLFRGRGTRRGWVVSSTPRLSFTPGKNRYPFYRRLGGPQDRSGRAGNLVPTWIRSRTVQPVVSPYTDWATRPTINNYFCVILIYSLIFYPRLSYTLVSKNKRICSDTPTSIQQFSSALIEL